MFTDVEKNVNMRPNSTVLLCNSTVLLYLV